MEDKFKDIVGYKEEKEELKNMCNIINKRKEIKEYGCAIPKGLFIVGPNGVGKTMMANLLIQNIVCKVIKIEENEFTSEEDFKCYIKDKFYEASKEEFAIIFIDEVDKMIGNNLEYSFNENYEKSTILLNEINKYSNNDNIFLLMVGNDELQIGRSLLRAGRIDKIININLPNNNEREQIIKKFMENKKFSKEIDINEIVSLTKNKSCATIKNILNDALIKAFVKEKKEVTQEDLRDAYFNYINIKKDKVEKLDKQSLTRLAVHEVSHAIVLIKLGEVEVSKISILGNGVTCGYVSCNDSDMKVPTLKDEEARIAVSLAGYIGEQIYFGNVGAGSIRDLSFAKERARDLVCSQAYFGFDKLLSNELPFESTQMVSTRKLSKIEKCETRLIKRNAKNVKKILRKNKKIINTLTEKLINAKVLYKEEIYKICG